MGSNPTDKYACDFFHRPRVSTEHKVPIHISVHVKDKINILYPRCKFIIYQLEVLK